MLSDLRIAAGRLPDVSFKIISCLGTCHIEIIETQFLMSERADLATAKARELKLPIRFGRCPL